MSEKDNYHEIPGLTGGRERRGSRTLEQITALSKTLGRTARDIVIDEEKASKVAVVVILASLTFGTLVVAGTLAYMSINQRIAADTSSEQYNPGGVSTPSWSYKDILQEQLTPTVLPQEVK